MLGDQNREAAVRHLAAAEDRLQSTGAPGSLETHLALAQAYAMLALVDAQKREVLW